MKQKEIKCWKVKKKKKKKKVLKGCALHVDIHNIPPFSPLCLLEMKNFVSLFIIDIGM